MSDDRNYWGTLKADVTAEEFCVECEREAPHHYDRCPTRPNVVYWPETEPVSEASFVSLSNGDPGDVDAAVLPQADEAAQHADEQLALRQVRHAAHDLG